MKLVYQEAPEEWRKSALLTALGLALLISLLCWRGHLSMHHWSGLAGLILIGVIAAVQRPRWFRGSYRFSLWLGFHSSQFAGRGILLLFFILIITPLGWMLRFSGKDLLQIKRPGKAVTFWHPSKESSPLDRLY
jgi:hypothetical protein